MTTLLECARLCDAVYETNPSAAGWTRIGFHEAGYLPQSAFQGAAFQKAGTVVFAFKGTSVASRSAVGDVVADLKLGIGMNTVQFDLAGQFVADTLIPDGNRVLLTGHSLGGAIAQIVGNRRRLPFVTFNAPGVGVDRGQHVRDRKPVSRHGDASCRGLRAERVSPSRPGGSGRQFSSTGSRG
ncbi:MAG: hypothetical protein R3E97_24135 [Candidatus Eisenbacteria bacterium]